MIKAHEGMVTIEGDLIPLLADLSCIAHTLKEAILEQGDTDNEIIFELLTEAIRLGVYDDTPAEKQETIGCLLSEEQLKKILEEL